MNVPAAATLRLGGWGCGGGLSTAPPSEESGDDKMHSIQSSNVDEASTCRRTYSSPVSHNVLGALRLLLPAAFARLTDDPVGSSDCRPPSASFWAREDVLVDLA